MKADGYSQEMELSDGIAIGSALIAGWAVFVAHRSNGRAKTANAIAQDALDAQKLALPPVWSEAQPGGGQVVRFQNTSGRNIVVHSLEHVTNPRWAMLDPVDKLPVRVEYGDHFQIVMLAMYQSGAVRIKFTWAYEDEPEQRFESERGT